MSALGKGNSVSTANSLANEHKSMFNSSWTIGKSSSFDGDTIVVSATIVAVALMVSVVAYKGLK